MQADGDACLTRKKSHRSQMKDEGLTKFQRTLRRICQGEWYRQLQSNNEGWDDKDKTCQRAGDSHVEKLASVWEAGSNLNHCTKGTEGIERRRRRDQVREGGVNSVIATGQIVSHFMSQQDHQNGKSKGKSVEKIQGMVQDAGNPSHGFA